MRLILPSAVLLAALVAAPAQAGTLTYTRPFPCGPTEDADLCKSGEATFRGAPGEANALTIARDGDALVFREAVLALRAPAGCTQRTEREVACPSSGSFPPAAVVSTADGNDVVDASAAGGGTVLGGADGNYRLAGDMEIFGGAGDDVLVGANGNAVGRRSSLDGGTATTA